MKAKETVYGVIIGIACIMVYFSSSSSPTPAQAPAFTMEDFLSLEDGMTRSHVELILYHVTPRLTTKVGAHESYTWEDGSRVIGVTFEDDRLRSKWQIGL